MEDDCPKQKIKVEQRTHNMSRYSVMVCINQECHKKCDRERLPTIQERMEFNG